MTLSRQLLHPGVLIISPAVEPNEEPQSSIPPYDTSTYTKAGNRHQRSDVETNVWNGSDVDASGNPFLILSFDGPGPEYKWRVERASIGSVSGGWTNCEVHAGEINPENPYATLVDNSVVPNTDIADESSPIYVAHNQPLQFRFIDTGGTVVQGSDATARIQYTEEVLGLT